MTWNKPHLTPYHTTPHHNFNMQQAIKLNTIAKQTNYWQKLVNEQTKDNSAIHVQDSCPLTVKSTWSILIIWKQFSSPYCWCVYRSLGQYTGPIPCLKQFRGLSLLWHPTLTLTWPWHYPDMNLQWQRQDPAMTMLWPCRDSAMSVPLPCHNPAKTKLWSCFDPA